ncbi:MAG: hypothetical protein NWQ09_03650, partial [Nonlabens sp.]|nr:hypothetical protein [Nonlabens sp.]
MINTTTLKMPAFLRLTILSLSFFAFSQLSSAQARTCLRQACYDIISLSAGSFITNNGAPGAVGTIYRFPNAAGAVGATPAIDALVEVLSRSNGATITNIDLTGTGLDRAFQPNIFFPNAGDANVSFRITLVRTGTTTPLNSICFYATPFDIDGGPLVNEYSELSLTDAFTRSAQTQISVTRNANVIRGQNTDGLSAPIEPIDEDPRYTFSNYYENRNSFVFTAGKVGSGTNQSRFYSLVLERAQFFNPVSVFVTNPLLCGQVTRDNGSVIPGVTIQLLNSANVVVQTTTTDANGDYQFTVNRNAALPSESYTVREIDPLIDTQTGFAMASVSDVVGANDNLIPVTIFEASINQRDFVDGADFDRDGVADSVDVDDDNDGVLDTVEGGNTLNSDNDAFPNRIDRDSDNDGCPDVIEAGFSDPDGDGQVGSVVPPTVDAQGRVTSNNGSGYTTPRDGDGNGIPDYLEAGTPIVITSQPPNDISILPGGSVSSFTVAATGTALRYQWQLSTNGGTTFNNIANNANYSGVTSPTLTVTNAPNSFNNYRFRVVVTSASNLCVQQTSAAATLQVGSTFEIIKDDQPGTFNAAGNTITYNVTVRNTGNTTITNIALTDPNATLSQTSIATLPVGGSVTLTATHIITQAELNAGFVLNQITGSGRNSLNDIISDLSDDPGSAVNVDTNGNGNPDDITRTPLIQNPAIAIVKTGVFTDSGSG